MSGAEADVGRRTGARARVSQAVLAEGVRRLHAAGVPAARRDAEWLLAGLCGIDRVRLYADSLPVDAAVIQRYGAALDRRIRGEPIQYLLGWEDFCGLRVRVTPAVLIPRPETEGLAEWAGGELTGGAAVADVGTGSGCLAVAIATRQPAARVCAIDSSPAALAVAAENVRLLGVAGRVRLVAGDLLGAFARGPVFDIIVANPPYIPSAIIATLPVEVRAWEPHQALDGGQDGMDVHRRLIPQAFSALRPGGTLMMEMGDGQASDLAANMAAAGFTGIVVRTDLNGTERYAGGHRPRGSVGGAG